VRCRRAGLLCSSRLQERLHDSKHSGFYGLRWQMLAPSGAVAEAFDVRARTRKKRDVIPGQQRSSALVGSGHVLAGIGLCAIGLFGCAHTPPRLPARSGEEELRNGCACGATAQGPELFCPAAPEPTQLDARDPIERGACGLFAPSGTQLMNGDTWATCSVKQEPTGQIKLEIGLVTECSTQRGIDVIAWTAKGGPYHWRIDRAVDGDCGDDHVSWLEDLLPRSNRRCAPIVTEPFELQAKGSMIRTQVTARCVGTGKVIWGRARCVMPMPR
jgi:hypothetical protein